MTIRKHQHLVFINPRIFRDTTHLARYPLTTLLSRKCLKRKDISGQTLAAVFAGIIFATVVFSLSLVECRIYLRKSALFWCHCKMLNFRCCVRHLKSILKRLSDLHILVIDCLMNNLSSDDVINLS